MPEALAGKRKIMEIGAQEYTSFNLGIAKAPHPAVETAKNRSNFRWIKLWQCSFKENHTGQGTGESTGAVNSTHLGWVQPLPLLFFVYLIKLGNKRVKARLCFPYWRGRKA